MIKGRHKALDVVDVEGEDVVRVGRLEVGGTLREHIQKLCS